AFFAGFTYAPALLDAAPVKQVLQFKNVMIRGHGGKCLNIRHAGKKKAPMSFCSNATANRINAGTFTASPVRLKT
ncbi:MAG: hypothetical protein ACO3MW_13830, partial [Rhodospirillales bacterium]